MWIAVVVPENKHGQAIPLKTTSQYSYLNAYLLVGQIRIDLEISFAICERLFKATDPNNK